MKRLLSVLLLLALAFLLFGCSQTNVRNGAQVTLHFKGTTVVLTEEEIDYIHALFEKYGGKFPCV